jgi:hypothetical protein
MPVLASNSPPSAAPTMKNTSNQIPNLPPWQRQSTPTLFSRKRGTRRRTRTACTNFPDANPQHQRRDLTYPDGPKFTKHTTGNSSSTQHNMQSPTDQTPPHEKTRKCKISLLSLFPFLSSSLHQGVHYYCASALLKTQAQG